MIPLFSEGGFSDATVSGAIRRLLTVWCGPDGCSIASNLINGHSGIAATGVTLADLPVERQECRSFEGEAQMTPAANAVGGVGRRRGLGEPVSPVSLSPLRLNSLPDYLKKNSIQPHQGKHNLNSSWVQCANSTTAILARGRV
jgi:hypothetical protein